MGTSTHSAVMVLIFLVIISSAGNMGIFLIHDNAQSALNDTAAESIATGYAKLEELETRLAEATAQMDQVSTDRHDADTIVKQLIQRIARLEYNVIRLHTN